MMHCDATRRDHQAANAPLRPRSGRRGIAAALSRLRHDGRRAGCAVRPLLVGDEFLRAAVVCPMRVCLALITTRTEGLDGQKGEMDD
jgi:hypothetical protein